jgi:hypothetical protein
MSYFDRRYSQELREHERDLRHDEPRPTDDLPARFAMPVATALEVAILVKGVKNIRDAEKLVEQYARTVAATARLDAVVETSDRIIKVLEAPLARPSHA